MPEQTSESGELCLSGVPQPFASPHPWLSTRARFSVLHLSKIMAKNKPCVPSRSVTQSCPTLCDPMDGSPRGSSVHEMLQARTLEGLPCPPPGALPDPGITPTPLVFLALARLLFTTSTTWEAPCAQYFKLKSSLSSERCT